MFKFYHNLLPSAFHYFFTPIASWHKYYARLSSKPEFCIPTARTNYGKLNIRFKGLFFGIILRHLLKFFAFTNFSDPLKSLLLRHINYLIYTSSLLQSV